jgi:hypothetical protein
MAFEDNGFISTSKLAKELNMPIAHVSGQLQEMGLLVKVGEKWELTEAGKQRGAKYISSPKFGTWIAWPKQIIKVESIVPGVEAKPFNEIVKEHHQSATTLGRTFGIPVTRMNYILSELGWIQKYLKGWKLTQQGAAAGGEQREDSRSGVPFVAWPDDIATNATLCATIADLQGTAPGPAAETELDNTSNAPATGFRARFPAQFRATDGHFVRSKAEMLIDNWLYMAEIVHAYERKLPVEEDGGSRGQ